MKSMLVPVFGLLLVGCNEVRVVNSSGIPIENAEVYSIGLSTHNGYNLTNSDGYASLPMLPQKVVQIGVCMGEKHYEFTNDNKYPITCVVP